MELHQTWEDGLRSESSPTFRKLRLCGMLGSGGHNELRVIIFAVNPDRDASNGGLDGKVQSTIMEDHVHCLSNSTASLQGTSWSQRAECTFFFCLPFESSNVCSVYVSALCDGASFRSRSKHRAVSRCAVALVFRELSLLITSVTRILTEHSILTTTTILSIFSNR